jgi:hypothetical protein
MLKMDRGFELAKIGICICGVIAGLLPDRPEGAEGECRHRGLFLKIRFQKDLRRVTWPVIHGLQHSFELEVLAEMFK